MTLLASGLSIFLFMLYLLDLPLPEFMAPPRIYLCELIIGNSPPPFFLAPLGSSELNLAALYAITELVYIMLLILGFLR